MTNLPSPLQRLEHPLLTNRKINLYVKRDDLIHPEIMGNKWRKLKYNIIEAKKKGYNKVITVGGAFSNHIAATAAAGRIYNLATHGIIRGEELNEKSNRTLSKAHLDGMKFSFIGREAFRKIRNDPSELKENYHENYFLPEGGTNKFAIKGASEIIHEIKIPFDWIVCPIGTGGTFCGLLNAALERQKVLGVSSLKGNFIVDEIKNLLQQYEIENSNYLIDTEHHFGGYGKMSDPLIEFIQWFKETFRLQVDPIYTSKAFFSVWRKVEESFFKENDTIILLHTGGLQGIKP